MKRTILCLLLLSLLLALTGCGGSSVPTPEASTEPSKPTISTEAPSTKAPTTASGTEAPGTEATTTVPPTTETPGTEDLFLTLPETLDDSYSLEDFRFRLSELTPRDLLAQGWVETDAILMRSMGADNPYAQMLPEAEQKDPNATPELSEEGMLDPDGMVQIYLVPSGGEDSPFTPLRLGVVNTGKEAVHYLDCPIRFFSINEAMFYEQTEEGLVDFSGPAGITRGMDKAQLLTLLGEPVHEDGSDGRRAIFYLSQRMEELVLLLDSEGRLQAMFFQDLARYDPAGYVFHN